MVEPEFESRTYIEIKQKKPQQKSLRCRSFNTEREAHGNRGDIMLGVNVCKVTCGKMDPFH